MPASLGQRVLTGAFVSIISNSGKSGEGSGSVMVKIICQFDSHIMLTYLVKYYFGFSGRIFLNKIDRSVHRRKDVTLPSMCGPRLGSWVAKNILLQGRENPFHMAAFKLEHSFLLAF